MSRYDDEGESFAGDLRATLGEHLEELRVRLFRVIGAVVVGMGIGWWAFKPLTDHMYLLAAKVIPKNVEFQWSLTDISQGFFLQLKFSFYIGVLLALPYVVFELWGFVKPGLKPHERKPIRIVAPISVALFALGAFLAYLILPLTVLFFVGFVQGSLPAGTVINQDPEKFIMFQAFMILAFGLGFQLPLITYFLSYVGLIPPKMMSRYWRQGIVAVFLLSALLTPGGDIPSMMLLALPLTGLFFGSIAIANWAKSKNKAIDPLDDLD